MLVMWDHSPTSGSAFQTMFGPRPLVTLPIANHAHSFFLSPKLNQCIITNCMKGY
jgi:hypothetical protein